MSWAKQGGAGTEVIDLVAGLSQAGGTPRSLTLGLGWAGPGQAGGDPEIIDFRDGQGWAGLGEARGGAPRSLTSGLGWAKQGGTPRSLAGPGWAAPSRGDPKVIDPVAELGWAKQEGGTKLIDLLAGLGQAGDSEVIDLGAGLGWAGLGWAGLAWAGLG